MIERIFREGKSFGLFPFRVYYIPLPAYSSRIRPFDRASSLNPLPSVTPVPIILSGPGGTHSTAPSIDASSSVDASSSLDASPSLAASPSVDASPSGEPSPIDAIKAPEPITSASCSPIRLQAGFGASSRNFKKAVDRNRIKRLTREAYRLQKQVLYEWLKEKDRRLAVFFIYTGKELPDYAVVKEKMGLALQKLMKEPGS